MLAKQAPNPKAMPSLKPAKEEFLSQKLPMLLLLLEKIKNGELNKQVPKVEKVETENGPAYIFFEKDGETPSHILTVRPGKQGERASYLLSKPPREGEKLNSMEFHEVGSEVHAHILMDALSEDSMDPLSEYVSPAMGYALNKDGKWMMVFGISGISPQQYLNSSRMERLERSKKIVGTMAALHSMGLGYDGGLSFEAVDFAAGKAKARNPVKLYALQENEKQKAFFELVTTLAKLGRLPKKEFSEIAKEYTRHSPACRDIVRSYMKQRNSALPMHRFVAEMAHKYSFLFRHTKEDKAHSMPEPTEEYQYSKAA